MLPLYFYLYPTISVGIADSYDLHFGGDIMSESMQNRGKQTFDLARQHHLKRLIGDLHAGRDAEEVKREFMALFSGVSSEEIAAIEAQLVLEGMAIEEIQKLCDVHAAILGASISDLHKPTDAIAISGHPMNQFELENKALEKLIDERLSPALAAFSAEASNANSYAALDALNQLTDVDKHYLRKENLVFPFLEEAGITAPPKVMWGVHDEIRAMLKKAKEALIKKDLSAVILASEVAQKIIGMIYKERTILFPMLVSTLSEDEWIKVDAESEALGYCLVLPEGKWMPERLQLSKQEGLQIVSSSLNLKTGILKPAQLELMLNHLLSTSRLLMKMTSYGTLPTGRKGYSQETGPLSDGLCKTVIHPRAWPPSRVFCLILKPGQKITRTSGSTCMA
jgi:DUF438 domain-containing protein